MCSSDLTGASESGGRRVAGGAGGDRVSRPRGTVARDRGTRPAERPRGEAGERAGHGADGADREAEVGTAGEPPVATGGTSRGGTESLQRD